MEHLEHPLRGDNPFLDIGVFFGEFFHRFIEKMEKAAEHEELSHRHPQRIKAEKDDDGKTAGRDQMENRAGQKAVFGAFALKHGHLVVLLFIFAKRKSLHGKDLHRLDACQKIEQDGSKGLLVFLELARDPFHLAGQENSQGKR